MYETAPYFYGTGRRKSSVARVRVYQGTGKVTINDRDKIGRASCRERVCQYV